MRQTIGYARVSTGDQDVSLQLDALRQAGCADAQIFLDGDPVAYGQKPALRSLAVYRRQGLRSWP
jgi:DNA invertase Pin-like site-specific DNA recombinase